MIDFSSLVTEHLQNERAKDYKQRTVGKYYASELGNDCMRQSYYRYTIEKPLEPFTLGVFALGTILHGWFGEVVKLQLEPKGFKVELEKDVPSYVNGKFEVHGRADIVIDNELIVDVKTVSPNAFKYKSLPYETHKAQLNFYMHQLKIKKAQIIYLDKYALRIESYNLVLDTAFFRKSISQIRFLHECLSEKKPPKQCENYPEKYPCNWCDYKEECKQ